MKAVLISIQPKWCEKIANGQKTIEVRKTAPKIATPFKCYIYETQGETETPWMDEEGHMIFRGRGQVIGEFVCPVIEPVSGRNRQVISALSCVPLPELYNYAGAKGLEGLKGWHISNLVIYDEPKELTEFCVWKKCNSCKTSGYECAACIYDDDCKVPAMITRPPQSWRYIMEAKNEQHSF